MENHLILTLEGLASSGCIVPSEQKCAIGVSLKFKRKDAGLRSLSLWGRLYTELGKDYLLAEGVKTIKLVDRKLVFDTRYYFSQNGALWLDLQAPTNEQFLTCKKISGLFKGDPSHTYFVPDPPPPPLPPLDPFVAMLPKASIVKEVSGEGETKGEEEAEGSDPDATSESEPDELEEVAVEDDQEGPDPELNPNEEEGEKEPEKPKGQDIGELVRLASLMRWVNYDCGVVPVGGMALDGNKNLVQNLVFPGMKFAKKLDSYGHLYRGYEKAPLSKDIVEESGSSGPRRNLRFLKANYIKDLTLLGQVDEPLDLKNPFLDISSLRSREDAAIRQAEAEAERIGVGVSTEAQDIFDALSKTLPVRWERMSIVVMNEVRVNQPYLPDNVVGGTPAANDRVKKVLEFERKRLQGRGTS